MHGIFHVENAKFRTSFPLYSEKYSYCAYASLTETDIQRSALQLLHQEKGFVLALYLHVCAIEATAELRRTISNRNAYFCFFCAISHSEVHPDV